MEKLYIAMVGLPSRGKSVIARKLKENLEKEGIPIQVFNNGDVRRRLLPQNTSHAEFYDPGNEDSVKLREEIALVNIYDAKNYIAGEGRIAVLDATNVTHDRRYKLRCHLNDYPILFIECINEDLDLVAASIQQKTRFLSEFSHLSPDAAFDSMQDRIEMYRRSYDPLGHDEENFITIDSLHNRIIDERVNAAVPFYSRVRDVLVSDWVKSLFLVRHGETYHNLEHRIGGDPNLTAKGRAQAQALADHFRGMHIPFIIRSTKKRALQTSEPILEGRSSCTVIPLSEFDEINAGVCDGMTYQEIQDKMPGVYTARGKDKYNYIYPEGESYATLKRRVYRGVKKALYLSGNAENIMLIGHQAVNRTILSLFLFRRTEDVPYIYVPQNKFFHIISTQTKKLFELHQY